MLRRKMKNKASNVSEMDKQFNSLSSIQRVQISSHVWEHIQKSLQNPLQIPISPKFVYLAVASLLLIVGVNILFISTKKTSPNVLEVFSLNQSNMLYHD